MRQVFVVVAALLAGFVGGILGTRVMPVQERSHSESVVRARSFELVNDAGRTISYWGVDNGENVVLAFGGRRAITSAVGGNGRPPLELADPHNQRVAIGVIDESPFLYFRGTNGEIRARMDLNIFEKPALSMWDEKGPRLLLGVEQSDTPGPQDNDWVLSFLPDRVWLGMHFLKEGGQTFVQGGFSVKRDKLKYPYQHAK